MIVRKVLAFTIILLFISVSVIPSTGTVVEKRFTMPTNYNGNTLYVGGSGPGNYTKIQDAIDNASDGDTVFVYDDLSPYYEYISMYKSITLIGEDRNSTVIDGSSIASVVYVSADGVKIRGFTIQNSGNTWDDAGIIIWSDNNIISGNIVTNNFKGIYLEESSNNIITGNIITNSGYYGIIIEVGVNNIISRNIITDNGIKGSLSLNIGLLLCENHIISGNTLANSDYAIVIAGSNKNNITGNTIKKSYGAGIYLVVSSNNNIFYNNFLHNKINALFYGEFNNCSNKWQFNFWDRPRLFPYPIFGQMALGNFTIPWINFDWRPSREPYDIPGV